MGLTAASIERRLIAFIDAHLETYLAAQEEEESAADAEQAEVFPLLRPATIARFNDQVFAETDLPAIVVSVPDPARAQRGMSRGEWDVWLFVQVAVITSASEALYARDNAGTYLAALRWMFTTNQTVDGLAAGVEYIADGLTDPFSVEQSRYMAAGELDVSLLIRGIASRTGRPDDAAPEPIDGPPEIATQLTTP